MAQTTRKNRINDNRLVLEILIIVFLVILIFEGQLIYTMFTFRSSQETAEEEELSTEEEEAEQKAEADAGLSPVQSAGISLAGLSDANIREISLTAETQPSVSDPDNPAIVPRQSVPVDDSYFSDAVFIGDSRMEGFRNSSGITTGTFFTSVGMSLSSMTNSAIISTANGNVTVPAALSGGKYGKIYVMLGANDLGTYDWDAFKEGFAEVLNRFREIQPDAIIYVCGCIYVEEAKVTTGAYVNNANVDILNEILLEATEEEGDYFLNLNEALSDGAGALIAGASADGVHLNQEYYEIMLNYMKTHYIPVDEEEETEDWTESESETEAESGDQEGEA